MDDAEEASAAFLESSRFWIQRVFVPILVFIGVGGNVVTVMILTRRRMRCTTTIYLTALAVADLIYLLFVLLLSFEHYPNIHDKKYELYWRFYGITHWICDAASSTSVWLTVSFTIERYIIVCHPLKGKAYCTEGRAKNIITVVSLLCLITTASTTFEHQLTLKEHCIQPKCKNITNMENMLEKIDSFQLTNTSMETSIEISNDVFDDETILSFNKNNIDDDVREKRSRCVHNDTIHDKYNTTQQSLCNENITCNLNDTCCIKTYTIYTEPTELGKNVTYNYIFYWFSSIIFGILPIVLIATFNCFLVKAIFKSLKTRKAMTNRKENKRQTNENRITILLIGVVILFLICQTPTASFLIYDAFDGASDRVTTNIKRACGNIFNFLLNLNAACNFVLYTVLSNNYRRTFKSVFCNRSTLKEDSLSRAGTSRYNFNSSTIANGIRRNHSEYKTPRNLETQSLNSIPRSKSMMQRTIGKARSNDLHV